MLRPYVEELSRIAPIYVSCHPNAGLPNAFGGFDETPEMMARTLGEFAANGWLNIVGGCCGTTPPHIRAIAEAVSDKPPRRRPKIEHLTRLSGLEPLTLRPDSNFTMIGERTNVTGSKKFARLILGGDFEAAVAIAREQVEAGANIIDVNMDEGMLDGEAAMTHFLNLIAAEPDISRVPIMVDSSKWSVIEAGLKCVQGKAIVNSISLKEGEEEFLRTARLVRRYGAAVVVMAFDEHGQATEVDHKVAIAQRAYHLLTEQVGMPAEDIIFDPNILTVATGIEEHNHYAINFIEATRQIKRALPGRESLRRREQHFVLVPRQRRGARGDARVLPLSRDPRRARHGHRQRRAVGRLRGDRPAAQGAGRRRPAQPPARRHRAAGRVRRDGQDTAPAPSKPPRPGAQGSIEERLAHALVKGIVDHIDERRRRSAAKIPAGLAIIEGPLMDGMQMVGDLFGAGKMFLPQVVKSARVMKKAVAYLLPFMEAEKAAAGAAAHPRAARSCWPRSKATSTTSARTSSASCWAATTTKSSTWA